MKVTIEKPENFAFMQNPYTKTIIVCNTQGIGTCLSPGNDKELKFLEQDKFNMGVFQPLPKGTKVIIEQ